jgi:hypothetical protein
VNQRLPGLEFSSKDLFEEVLDHLVDFLRIVTSRDQVHDSLGDLLALLDKIVFDAARFEPAVKRRLVSDHHGTAIEHGFRQSA